MTPEDPAPPADDLFAQNSLADLHAYWEAVKTYRAHVDAAAPAAEVAESLPSRPFFPSLP